MVVPYLFILNVFFKHTFSFSMDILFINLTLGQNLSYFYQIIYISFMCMEDLYHTMKKIMQLNEMIAACYIETSGSFIRIFFIIFLGNLLRSVLFFVLKVKTTKWNIKNNIVFDTCEVEYISVVVALSEVSESVCEGRSGRGVRGLLVPWSAWAPRWSWLLKAVQAYRNSGCG